MSWDDLKRKPARLQPAADEKTRLCGIVFGSGAGAELLALLHREIVDAVLPANVDEALLRDVQGRRRLIRELETAVERHREATKSKPKDQRALAGADRERHLPAP